MTILSVAYPLAPVGPDAVGGAEQILTAIDAALSRRGHRSIVIACEGSRVTGELIATPLPRGTLDETSLRAARARCRSVIATTLAREDVDLVHMHGLDFHEYLPPGDVPVLATLHLPPQWIDGRQFSITRPNTFFQCVSDGQKAAMPGDLDVVDVIQNGVDIESLAITVRKRPFAVALGRVCPEKGLHLAMEAARHASFPLLVAGRVFPYDAHRRYFESEIVPRIDRLRRFIGPIGRRRKRRLLTSAQCVVVPSLAPETGSLVAMEALACGTPVVAFPSGALADVVEHGVTGFLVRTIPDMADAIVAARALSQEACRAAARARFSSRRMTERYIALYSRLVANTATVVPDLRQTSAGIEAEGWRD